MVKNLLISYDLFKTGQNYGAISEKIQNLGSWAKVNQSVWYLRTTLEANDVLNKLKNCVDKNDKIIVIDATNNSATWFNLNDDVSNFLINNWSK